MSALSVVDSIGGAVGVECVSWRRPIFWVDDETKKTETYSNVALDGRRLITLYTTTTGGMGRRWDRSGARRQRNTIVLGVIVLRINRTNYPIIICR